MKKLIEWITADSQALEEVNTVNRILRATFPYDFTEDGKVHFNRLTYEQLRHEFFTQIDKGSWISTERSKELVDRFIRKNMEKPEVSEFVKYSSPLDKAAHAWVEKAYNSGHANIAFTVAKLILAEIDRSIQNGNYEEFLLPTPLSDAYKSALPERASSQTDAGVSQMCDLIEAELNKRGYSIVKD